MKLIKRPLLIEILGASLILLWIYAATSKLLDYDTYVGQMNNQPFDNRFTELLTVGIPSIEYILATLLIVPRWRKWGFGLSAIAMLAFTLYIATVLANFYGRVPCSCGGVISKLSWTQHLLFNIVFLVIAIWGYYLTKNSPGPKRPKVATTAILNTGY